MQSKILKNIFLLKEIILFSPLEDKIHIFVPPCNILSIYHVIFIEFFAVKVDGSDVKAGICKEEFV